MLPPRVDVSLTLLDTLVYPRIDRRALTSTDKSESFPCEPRSMNFVIRPWPTLPLGIVQMWYDDRNLLPVGFNADWFSHRVEPFINVYQPTRSSHRVPSYESVMRRSINWFYARLRCQV